MRLQMQMLLLLQILAAASAAAWLFAAYAAAAGLQSQSWTQLMMQFCSICNAQHIAKLQRHMVEAQSCIVTSHCFVCIAAVKLEDCPQEMW